MQRDILRVLYDHQIFGSQNHGGISRYFWELMRCYWQSGFLNFTLSLRFSNNVYINGAPFSNHRRFFPGVGIGVVRRARKALWKWNVARSRELMKCGQFDVLHPTYYDTYFLDCIGEKPFVLTVHDMIHDLFQDGASVDVDLINKRELVRRASAIIAVSHNTKNDLLRLHGADAARIAVVHHGTPRWEKYRSDLAAMKGVPGSFVLFVGKREGYKNFQTLIRALAPALRKRPSLNVVCVGGGRFRGFERALIDDLGVSARVLQLSVDDRELALLYRRAELFVFPSSYEGFGMPILEAFACDCPVALSGTSSFPEVAGDAGVYFDPVDEGGIREAVERLLDDKELRAACVKRGRARLEHFTWERAAKQTAGVYSTVLGSDPSSERVGGISSC